MALLMPREGLSRREFEQYWLHRHGPLVANTPGYGLYRLRYSQDHIQSQGPWGQPFGYVGLAQVLIPPTAEGSASFSETWQFRQRILPDEKKFLNRQTSVALSVDQVQVVPGNSPQKMVMLSAPARGRESGEIRQEYTDHYLPQVLGNASLAAQVCGWSVSFVTAPPISLDGIRTDVPVSIACVEEVWFKSPEAMCAAAKELTSGHASATRRRMFLEDASSSFTSSEYVLFQDGRPTEML